MRRGAFLALSAVLVVGASACDVDELLEVDDPDIVTPDVLTGPTGLETLRAGAIGDFAFAYAGDGGGTEGQVLVSGMFTDEYIHSGTFTTRREFDRRDIRDDNGTATGVFGDLQRARQALETAAGRIQEAGGDERVGELLAMASASYNMFGENYCSGVPFSSLDESGNLVPGEPQTTEEIFQLAVTRADEAIAGATGNELYANLAAIQKGRALLNLGQYSQAASAVASVPTDYLFQLTYSIANGQENGIYAFNATFERWSLANNEGGNGLLFRDRLDPRVPWNMEEEGGCPDQPESITDCGFDEVTPQWNMLKYPGRAAPADLAAGAEARLIEAEAALQAGDPATMINKINEVRTFYGLEPVTDPGDEASRVDLLFEERAFTLFATSHRLGDLRRLIRQYGRTEDEVFPTGQYETGDATYGDDVNLPVPFDEENNPNFTGCLNREA
jgi:hypothetical protein